MATHEEKLKVTVEGNAKKQIDDVKKSVDEAKKSTDQNAKATSGMADKVAGAAAAFAAYKVVIQDTIKAYTELDASAGRLGRSLGKVGGDLDQANKTIRANTQAFGVGILEQQDAMTQLLKQTKDQTLAESDLRLAININAQENLGLAASADLVKKARQGDVAVLEQLGLLTKGQAAELGTLANEQDKVNKIMRIAQGEYSGAAETNKGYADTLARTEERQKQISAALGNMSTAFLTLIGVISPDGRVTWFDRFATGMENFAKETRTATGEVDLLTQAFSDLSGEEIAAAFLEGGSGIGGAINVLNKVADQYDRNQNSAARESQIKGSGYQPNTEILSERGQGGSAGGFMDRVAGAAPTIATGLVKKKRKRGGRPSPEAPIDTTGFEGDFDSEYARLDSEEAKQAAADLEAKRAKDQHNMLKADLDLREKIAKLRLEGRDTEADILRILNSNLSYSEKQYEIKKLTTAEAEAQEAAEIARVKALSASVGGVLALAGQEEAAKRLNAGIDAAVFGYKLAGAIGDGNILGAIQYGSAAIQAGAVAAGAGGASGGGGGGGLGKRAAFTNATQTASEARGADDGPRETTINVYTRSVAKPTPAEGRVIARAIDREYQTQVGGRR